MNYIMNHTDNRREYHLALLNILFPPYYDDGHTLWPVYRRGFKNPHKQIYPLQCRMYRTWKHNRKTRWK